MSVLRTCGSITILTSAAQMLYNTWMIQDLIINCALNKKLFPQGSEELLQAAVIKTVQQDQSFLVGSQSLAFDSAPILTELIQVTHINGMCPGDHTELMA
jgi:hypothetical protein